MQPAQDAPPIPSLDALRELVDEDWTAVNRLIVKRLGSDVALAKHDHTISPKCVLHIVF